MSENTAVAKERNRQTGLPEVTVNLTVAASITPESVAELFWSMGDDQQARFFNYLALVAGHSLGLQLAYVTAHPLLDVAGRRVMDEIGKYAEPPSEAK